jgi:RimJ/RimL family protein N-acetyltransferase
MSILTGRSVVLRPPEPDDLPDLRRILNHPALAGRRYLPDGVTDVLPLSTFDMEQLRDKWRHAPKEPAFVVTTREGGSIVGHAGMGWDWDPLDPWASVVIDPDQWRRGYGSDALGLLLDFLFGYMPAHCVGFWTPDWNSEGLAFASAMGYQRGGRLRRAGLRDGRSFDTVSFDLLRPEWQARRDREVHDAARG